MKALLLFCISLLLMSPVMAQQQSAGARSVAMGGVSVMQSGIHAALGNPAGMAFADQTSFTVFGENRFGLADIKSVSAAALIAINNGSFGVRLNYFGFERFNRQTASLAYGRKLFDRFSIGGSVDFIQTNIPEYGNQSALTFGLGFHSKLLDRLYWAGHIYSPIKVDITEDEALPTTLRTGLSLEVSKQVWLMTELEKDIDHPLRFRAGLEYGFYEQLFFRAGLSTQPTTANFGFGYEWKNGLSMDIGASFHSVLGLSPSFSANYAIGKK